MSGLHGGSDGSLAHSAVEVLAEVAKQAKFLVAPCARASLESHVTLLGRLQLNGFEVTDDASVVEGAADRDDANSRVAQGHSVGIAVFPSGARFNHSCRPNCRVSFDSLGCLCVAAADNIPKGSELTITYIDTRAPRVERRAKLLETFAFECECERCVEEASAPAGPKGKRKR